MESSRVTVDALLAQRGWVRGLARTLVGDEQGADDVEQDAWLAALRRPPRPGGSLRAWFASVVRSRVRDRRRLDARRAGRETAAARSESTPSAADVASSTEIHRRLVAALLALPEPYRSAVILRYFEDLPPRGIAARTGVPVETARTRVRRGIEQLRERLDAGHGGDRRAWCALVAPLGAGRSAALTGGTIVATKKTAVLAALLLLALGAGAGVWSATRSRALPVAANDPGARPSAETARAPRAGRATTGPAAAPAAATATNVAEAKPDRPVVAVTDSATRRPVEFAQIAVSFADGNTSWFNFADAAGRFVLDPALTGRTATVWAYAPGHARRRLPGVKLAADVLSIALDPAEPLQLKFVTETGRALDAAEVRARFGGAIPTGTFEIVADEALGGDVAHVLRALFGPPSEWHSAAWLDSGTPGLRLTEGLSKGRWRLFVLRPDATPWLSEPFVADGTSAPSVTVPLPETIRTRRVRVVADDTKEPLPGVPLVAWYEFGDGQAFLPGASVVADAQGVATLPYDPPQVRGGVHPTTWWVRAPGRVGMVSAAAFDDPSAPDPVDVAVPKSATVEGEAYLRSGEPAAGFRVVTAVKGLVCGAVVGTDGRFRMREVPVRDGAVDLVLLAGETFTQTRAAVGADGVAHAVLGAKAAPGTHGRIVGVVTTGGAPLAGAIVVDQPRDAKGSFVRTDADGRFSLDGLDVAVEHDFVVYPSDPQADDSAYRIRTASALRVDADKPLQFAFDLPAGAIRVRVVDADTGKPVARARVAGAPADRNVERSRFAGFDYGAGWAGFTDDDGALLLRTLVPATAHRVSVLADGYEAASREGVVPGTVAAPAESEIRLKRK